jgi:hypothetical protein
MDELLAVSSRLLSEVGQVERDKALAEIKAIASEPGFDATLVTRVLRCELDLAFFEADHFRKTVAEKAAFDFQMASQTSRILSAIFPKGKFGFESPLFSDACSSLVKQARYFMQQDGFYRMPQRLEVDFCQRIIDQLHNVDFKTKATNDILTGYSKRNLRKCRGNTSWVLHQQDVLKIPEVQKLVIDPVILNIVQNYLECTPIHVQSNCWWTINHQTDEQTKCSDAQMFHQDKEFIRFVKVFVYLTDVGHKNGPHTYIAGSARDYQSHVPADYAISQRLSDDYLRQQYAPEKFVSMTGPKGTVLIEDTSGFHKGDPVVSGHRLMLQLEYACSMYFNPVPSFGFEGLTDSYLEFARSNPRMFQNYCDDRCREQRNQRIVSLPTPAPRESLKQRMKKWLPRIKRRTAA